MAGSKKRQFAINTTSGVVHQGVRIVIGLVALRYIMWRLGLEAYGVSQLAQSALVFFGFLQLGMGPTLIRFCAKAISQKDHEEIAIISSTAQAILAVIGFIGMVAIIGFTPLFIDFYSTKIPPHLNFDVSMLLLCMAVVFFLNFITFVPNGLTMGSNRYDLANGVGIVGNVLRFGLIVLTFESLGPSIILLGVCTLLSQIVVTVSFFAIAAWHVGRSAFFSLGAVRRSMIKSLFGFSSLTLTNTLAGALIVQGPVLIIGKTIGLEAVALFAPAMLVASSIESLLLQMSTPLVPLASQAQAENNHKKMGDWAIMIGSLVVAIGLAIVFPLLLFGNEIIGLWLTPKMAFIWPIVAIMAAGTVVTNALGATYFLALGGGDIRPTVYSQIVLAILIPVGITLGIMFWGWHLAGVAAFIVLCRSLRSILYLVHAYSKQFLYSVSHYLFAVYAKPLFVCLCVMWTGFAIKALVASESLLFCGVSVFALLSVYAILVWCFVLVADMKENLRKMLRAFLGRFVAS